MRLKKTTLHRQREAIDERLEKWRSVSSTPNPRSGWLRAVRESLGISSRQLAKMLGTNNSAVLRLETRETRGTATLDALDRAARAMGCKLVYAVVPEESLEAVVDKKAHEAARRLMKITAHTMHLEKQDVGEKTTERQIEAMAQDLKARLDPLIWEK
jgi:predicted DNA-binding mobile mystery protein A